MVSTLHNLLGTIITFRLVLSLFKNKNKNKEKKKSIFCVGPRNEWESRLGFYWSSFLFSWADSNCICIYESGQNLTRHRPQRAEMCMIFIVSFWASFNVHLLGLKNCYWTAAALEPLVVGLCAQQVILSSFLSQNGSGYRMVKYWIQAKTNKDLLQFYFFCASLTFQAVWHWSATRTFARPVVRKATAAEFSAILTPSTFT